jgi:tetratricopeptide (TPR) repeat protein
MIRRYFLLALIPAAIAQGASDFMATPKEQAMCQALIYNGHDTSNRQNWGHMHHFCDCVRFTNRAVAQTGSERAFELGRAIDGCDYVLSHTLPDFDMRGEVHLQKGKALRMAGKDGLAAAEFIKALSINPDLVNAYTALGDFYARIGKRGEALNFVSEGLKHVPNSKALQRRYTELGGKLPYPEPLKPEQPAMAPSPDESPQTSTANPSIETTPAPEQEDVETPTKNDTSTTPKQPAKPPEPGSAAPIGTPANPWCRFCP